MALLENSAYSQASCQDNETSDLLFILNLSLSFYRLHSRSRDSKLFATVISRLQNLPLAEKELKTVLFLIVQVKMYSI